MCGIIYYKNKKDNSSVSKRVLKLYRKQQERGRQGFGFVGLSAKEVYAFHATQEQAMIEEMKRVKYDEYLFHHRQPTSTENVQNACHPFIIKMKGRQFYFVHNGIINNDDELKEQHDKQGIKYTSLQADGRYNDSEALAYDFVNHIVNKTEMTARGMIAFICLEVDAKSLHAKRLYFYRDYSTPLYKVDNDEALILASNMARRKDAKKINDGILYAYEYKTKKIKELEELKLESYRWSWSDTAYYNDYSGRDNEYTSIGFKSTDYTDIDLINDEIRIIEGQYLALLAEQKKEQDKDIKHYIAQELASLALDIDELKRELNKKQKAQQKRLALNYCKSVKTYYGD